MLSKIKASIIIPVYNGEKFIKKTIYSCLNQTVHEQIEIIVIDDCSSDRSKDIIKEFENKIRFFENKKNKGIVQSFNRGLNLAEGEFSMFLGQDDLLIPSHVENILSEFDEDTSIVFCDSSLINAEDKVIQESSIAKDVEIMLQNPFYFLIKTNFINVCGLLFRTKYALQIGGFNLQYRHFGEWEMWIRLAAMGNIKFSRKVKSFYRRHDTNITNKLMVEDMPRDLFKYYQNCRKLSFSKGNFKFRQKIYLLSLITFFTLSFYKKHFYFKILKMRKFKKI